MRSFVSGDAHEERLRSKLEGSCTIRHDQTFDHDYKIDFAITEFKAIRKFTEQIGIQVTVNVDDVSKQAEFVRISRMHADVIPRRVYLEVDSTADLDGVAEVVYGALLSVIFDKAHAESRLIGLRIGRNLTFEFFDLDANVERLRSRDAAAQPSTTPGELQGRLIRFSPKGYGWIERAGSENYWFHLTKVEPALREILETEKARSRSTTIIEMSLPVLFRDGEKRPGRTNPVAVDVRQIKQA